jgi:YHS domain-containing protein
MPPLGPLYGQRVIVDKRLTTDSEVAFSAGSHHDTIRMPYREFERLAQPTVAGPSITATQRTPILKDPVCGVTFEDGQAAERSDYGGEAYYFCSETCKEEFESQPQQYALR